MTTDPTPTPGTPRLAEAQNLLGQLGHELGHTQRDVRDAIWTTKLGAPAHPDDLGTSIATARQGIERIGQLAGAAQLAILGIDPDPVADLAPVAIEVTDEDVELCGEEYERQGPGDEYDGEGIRAALDLFAQRLTARAAAPVPPRPVTDAGAPARLVITGADVEVSCQHYENQAAEVPDPVGMRAALEAYALRIQHGLASGTTTPAEADSRPTMCTCGHGPGRHIPPAGACRAEHYDTPGQRCGCTEYHRAPADDDPITADEVLGLIQRGTGRP